MGPIAHTRGRPASKLRAKLSNVLKNLNRVAATLRCDLRAREARVQAFPQNSKAGGGGGASPSEPNAVF
jgi:hypothetical protein